MRAAIELLSRARPMRHDSCVPFLPHYRFVPASTEPADTIVVAVHGISRDAREQALAWRPLARQFGWPLVAPLFEPDEAPQYQRLGWESAGPRADLALDAVLARLGPDVVRPDAKLVLAGFSGGAQFCHRYAMSRPQRLRALIVGAAGWYTWPDATRPWPLGADTSRFGDDRCVDLPRFLRLPMLVYVGMEDGQRGPSLNTAPEFDSLQGPDRRERARRWVRALREAAASAAAAGDAGAVNVAAAGACTGSRLRLHALPGVGHDFRAAVRSGIVRDAGRWLESLDP